MLKVFFNTSRFLFGLECLPDLKVLEKLKNHQKILSILQKGDANSNSRYFYIDSEIAAPGIENFDFKVNKIQTSPVLTGLFFDLYQIRTIFSPGKLCSIFTVL